MNSILRLFLSQVEQIQKYHCQHPFDVREIKRLLAVHVADLREAIEHEESNITQEIG